MNYDENNLVKDFARRTRENLILVDSYNKDNYDYRFYEVTQLINSMLGLLVFPREKFYKQLPDKSLIDLENEGWPKIIMAEGSAPCKNLKSLTRYLRNGIAHCNIKFLSDHQGEISGIEIWNYCNNCNRKTWSTNLTVDDLRSVTEKFIDLIERVEDNG